MRTKNILKHLILGALLLTTGRVVGQSTTPGNVALGPTDFVGWDNTMPNNNFPLMVRHDLNQPIEWYTDALNRMKLYETGSGNIPLLSGGTVTFQRDGFLGISGTPGFFGTGGYGPFTRLHLADLDPSNEGPNHYALPWGYRTWMRNGITFTGNHDHAYIGHKYRDHDETDLVIHWSDNADKSPFGPDRLRFLFTTDNTNATVGSRSVEGLEFMRMFPVNALQGWIGVGNFAQPTLFPASDPEPTERLDILDRTIRLREFAAASPNSWQDETLNRVLVADDADGRVYWRNWPTTTGGGTDCDWTLQNSGTSGSGVAHHVYTALGTSDDCPDQDDLVGVGVAPSGGKVHVYANTVEHDVPPVGVFVRMEGDDDDSVVGVNVQVAPDGSSGYNQTGVAGLASNASHRNIGVKGTAELTSSISMSAENSGVQGESIVSSGTVTNAMGVYGYGSRSGGTVSNNYGVFGYGNGGTNVYGLNGWAAGGTTAYGLRAEAWSGGTNYGVFGVATGSGNYGGYFVGDVYITGAAGCNLMTWTSDGNLKTNVQTITDASAIIAALRPTTYNFDVDGHPDLQLPSGLQRGLIAQEVAQVMPDLVQQRDLPSYTDHDGVVHEGETVHSLNYIGLLPMMIAAMQEQQQQIAELQQALAACCAAPSDGGTRNLSAPIDEGDATTAQERLLRIAPNPFTDRTTLYYNLERAGRAQLLVNSADGRDLRVLSEAQRVAGEYQFEWDTTGLAPGMYYVTLLLDGEPVVKRAVKVQR